MEFVRFTEHNENEGESWNFWLQLEGNEEALQDLAKSIEDDEDYYRLNMTPVPEDEVDILIKHTDSGYMSYQNKVTGKLVVSFEGGDEKEDALYKGGIKNLFKK